MLQDTLHIRCGTDIQGALSEAGINGDFLAWDDPVCQGPVPHIGGVAYRARRAEFIAEAYGLPIESAAHRLEEQQAALEAASRYPMLLFWFEHDPYDQIILIQLLATLRDDLIARSRLIAIDSFPGVERFRGLGDLTPTQLATLPAGAETIEPKGIQTARSVWQTYRDGDIGTLQGMVDTGSPALPLLGPALKRLLQDLPSTRDGLGLTQRLMLQSVADLASDPPVTPARMFGRLVRDLDPLPFLGDLMAWPIIQGLADAANPALTPWNGTRGAIALTDTGRALLEGSADWAEINGTDHWLGGAHITGTDPAWRWDPVSDRVVRV